MVHFESISTNGAENLSSKQLTFKGPMYLILHIIRKFDREINLHGNIKITTPKSRENLQTFNFRRRQELYSKSISLKSFFFKHVFDKSKIGQIIRLLS